MLLEKAVQLRPSLFFLLPLLLALPVAAYIFLRFGGQPEFETREQVIPVAEEQPQVEEADEPQLPAPPASLAGQITALGSGFDGDVGIVVQSIDDGWAAAHDADRPFPQQSVSKLWVAMTVLDRVDKGELSLDEIMPLTTADLTIFHQPIRQKILAGGYRPTMSELLDYAITRSDNAANDALFRRVGGQAGVMNFLRDKELQDIRMSAGEKALQMAIVGMPWQDSFSYGRNFWRAREKLPFGARVMAMGAYLENPPDGATPRAIAAGLAALQKGELLSPASTAMLIELMARSRTGPKRLRGGLAAGWSLPHKTGTGQVLQALATAYNDVGILVSPGGRRYAVVVMIGATNRPVPERQELMQAVVRSVIQCEDLQRDRCRQGLGW